MPLESNCTATRQFEFGIIGAGISGSKMFFHLAALGTCVLLEKRNLSTPFSSAKMLCAHCEPWIRELDPQNNSIFIKPHWTSQYSSRDQDVVIDAHEMGTPFGHVINEYEIIRWYIEKGVARGGIVIDNYIATQITPEKEAVTIHANFTDRRGGQPHREEFSTQFLVIATGPHQPFLHSFCGIPPPAVFNQVSATFFGAPADIQASVPVDYMYCLHPQVSETAMLWMNRGKNFFNIGVVSKEPPHQLEEKFLRILRNYKKIAPFFKTTAPSLEKLTAFDLKRGMATRQALKSILSDRICVIGDAAGLLYPPYFEGLLGALCSAQIVAETVEGLKKENLPYTKENLGIIHARLKEHVIDSYFQAGEISNEMFFAGGETPPYGIWDAYLTAMKTYPQVRKNIHTAYVWRDMAHYPVENDYWCGEKIYLSLPMVKKMTLLPIFLKFKK